MKRNLVINELQKKIKKDTKIYELAAITPYSVLQIKNHLSDLDYLEIEALYKIVCKGLDYDKFRKLISKREYSLERILIAASLIKSYKNVAETFKKASISFSEANRAIIELMAKPNKKEKENEN